MPEDVKAEAFDVLSTNLIFPEAAAVFTYRAIPLEEAKESACIVLDTNS